MRGLLLALAALMLAPAVTAQTYSGVLTKSDQTLSSGEYVDSYTINVNAGQTLVVDLRSNDFDPYLIVKSPFDDQTDNDDWNGDQTHSRVEITGADGGTWEVLVTSYEPGETGAYTLRLDASGGNSQNTAALAELIRRVSNGGSQDWKQTVGLLITASSLDLNGSGVIEGPEVGGIGCDVWEAIEDGYAQGEYDRFWVGYGFKPDLIWNAESLGFAESARAPAWAAIQRCLPTDRPSRGRATSVASRIRSLSNPSTIDWKHEVGLLLVNAYDRNGSGAIESNEVGGIACADWQAIEDGYAQGEYDRFWVGYGFKPDLIWNAESLGFAESARATGWAAIQRCISNAD